jgi:hypothetical protein
VKLILSFVIGIIAGFLDLSGVMTHVFYGLACHVSIHFYATMQLGIDAEAIFGSASAFLTEGLMTSYAAFLLTWSMITTVRYGLQK